MPNLSEAGRQQSSLLSSFLLLLALKLVRPNCAEEEPSRRGRWRPASSFDSNTEVVLAEVHWWSAYDLMRSHMV